MRKYHVYLFVSVVVAAAASFFTHVYLQGELGPRIHEAMSQHPVVMPPYPFYITAVAFVTRFIPTAALLFIFVILYDRLPGKGPVVKSLTFTLLFLAAEGHLVRFPLMNVLVGNPIWLALLVQVDAWISNLVLCMLLGFGIHFARKCKT